MRERLPLLALLAVLAGSFAFHAYRAEHPTTSYQSADERSYGKLAVGIADSQTYGNGSRDPLHWPPGAPFLFAAGHAVAPAADSAETFDIPSAYWLQALVSLGTALAAFALAALLAGAWAGVAAAALVGFYPPLILATGEQLSEPFGAFWMTVAFALFAYAARRGRAWLFAAGGVALGAAVLTRADLLPVPFVLAALVAVWTWRAGDGRRGLLVAGCILGGAVLAIAPWSVYASARAGELVPVTRGSSSALFVGTYLPGNGTTVGMKRSLGAAAKRRNPKLRNVPDFDLEARSVLAVVADRHPDMDSNAAIALEARKNISRYVREDPVGYAGMMLNKVQRMWSRYARGGARHTTWAIRGPHIALVLLAAAGADRGRPARPLAAARVHPRLRADLDGRREGEIAIAKRIEAGRETMIAGPLRDARSPSRRSSSGATSSPPGKILLRDIIDLEATYAGPDAKAAPAAPRRRARPSAAEWRGNGAAPPRPPPRPPVAKAAADAPPHRRRGGRRGRGRARPHRGRGGRRGRFRERPVARRDGGRAQAGRGRDLRHRRRPSTRSSAACRTRTSSSSSRTRRSRPRRSAATRSSRTRSSRRSSRCRLNQARIDSAGRAALRHQQAPDRLRGPAAPPRRDPTASPREDFLKEYQGAELDPNWLRRISNLSAKRLEGVRRQGEGPDQGAAPRDPGARHRDRPRDHRVPPHRPHGAEGRARGPPGEEGDGRGQPPPRDLDRQEIHQPRPAVPRPHPGRQHRPDEGGRQVRVPPRLQVLDLRHLVDPAGDHPLDRRPGPHHPHPGAHDRDDQQDRPHLAPDAPRDRPRADAGRARREAGDAAREGAQGPQDRQGADQPRDADRRRGGFATSAISSRTRTRSCRSTRRSSRTSARPPRGCSPR